MRAAKHLSNDPDQTIKLKFHRKTKEIFEFLIPKIRKGRIQKPHISFCKLSNKCINKNPLTVIILVGDILRKNIFEID